MDWVVVDIFLLDGIQRQKRKMVPRSHVDQFQNELNMFINYMKKCSTTNNHVNQTLKWCNIIFFGVITTVK